jgi:pimeloyl-ACP methyl ester carboxylesterase
MPIARHGAIELAYETFGAAEGEPPLLISGTGVQMLMWPDAFVATLADRKALAAVRIPTLVMHGDQDPIINVKAGRATAAAIPGARLVIYPQMGHDLPRELWSSILDEIAALAAQASARPSSPQPADAR